MYGAHRYYLNDGARIKIYKLIFHINGGIKESNIVIALITLIQKISIYAISKFQFIIRIHAVNTFLVVIYINH